MLKCNNHSLDKNSPPDRLRHLLLTKKHADVSAEFVYVFTVTISKSNPNEMAVQVKVIIRLKT